MQIPALDSFSPVIHNVGRTDTSGAMSCLRRAKTSFSSELLVMLRSEIPSGICAKLRTVAASNNRDHSIIACSRHTYIFVLRAHPVRDESHNQPIATGEVATVTGKNVCRKESIAISGKKTIT